MSNLKCVVALAVAAGLVLPNVAAADPLAAGKPAGVKQAQEESVSPLVWIAAASVVAAGIAAAASSGSSPSSFTTSPATTGTAA